MDVEDRDLTSDGSRRHAEALAAHHGFVRALARGLTAPSSVEDVAQEVLLAGLQSPPRNSGALRGWLATAVRNVACKLRRTETRRATRETAGAVREAMPSTRELVERIELAQTVVRAVVSLREPERTAVLWRFYEGRTTAEIGARLGVPADTVRARLRRGLEEVRRKLDGACGGRDAWLAALLPLAGLETAISGGAVAAAGVAKASLAKAAAVTGVATMAVKTWTAVAIASASAALAWWLAPAGFFEDAFSPRPPVVAERSSSAEANLPESAFLAGDGSALPLPAERALVDPEPGRLANLANAAVELAPPGHVLVRVLDARTGSPLDNVRIRFLHEQRFAEYSGHGVAHASLTSGPWEASVTATGYEPARLQSFEVVAGETTELGAVALSKGVAVIEGRVVARHLAGETAVKVQLYGDGRSPCGSESEPASCACGFQDGCNELDLSGDRRFRFGHLGAGIYWLRAFDPTQGIGDARRIEVARGGVAWQELDVTPPTFARLELRHDRGQGGGLFTGDWSSVHQESPSPIRFSFRRDGKVLGETECAPDPNDVRSTIGGPLLPLPGKESAANSLTERAWHADASRVYLDIQLSVSSLHFDLRDGQFVDASGGSAEPDERLDRERQEGDSLEFECAEPEVRVALLLERLRADHFEVRPLPRQRLTVVVSSDHYASQELPLDLTFDTGLPLVVTMFPTEEWSKELAAIALGPPTSCAACHDGEPSPPTAEVSYGALYDFFSSNPGEARFELNVQPRLRSGDIVEGK